MKDKVRDKVRDSFEKWVSSPPYEYDVERWPNNHLRYAWPGSYKDIGVELAYKAWCEATKRGQNPRSEDKINLN